MNMLCAKKRLLLVLVQTRNGLITLGNEMRASFGSSVLAELAVNQIRVDREKNGKDGTSGQFLFRRECRIIDSIKNQEELELLRTVYRESLYVLGIFSPVESRTKALESEGLSGPENRETG